MRLFVALEIDDTVRNRICRFVEGVRGFAPDARWMPGESWHITLKFIGEMPESRSADIRATLSKIASSPFEIQFRGSGFFPTPRMPRVFWIGIVAGDRLASLAASVDEQMGAVGIPRETHSFSPHLTLARGKGGSGAPGRQKDDRTHCGFQKLRERLEAMTEPDFGTMTAREFFLYRSQLSPSGSQYTKLAGFALK